MKWIIFSTLFFPLFTFAGTSPEEIAAQIKAVGPMDIAVDGERNLVFVQKSENNPGGVIHVVDATTGQGRGEIVLETLVIGKSTYEIELGPKGVLYFLVKNKHQTKLGAITLDKSEPQITYFSQDLVGGLSNVESLTAELNGKISIEAYDKNKNEKIIKLFDVASDSPALITSGEVSVEKFEQELKKIEAGELPKDEYAVEGKGVGFTAGWLTGVGFMYRQFFSNSWGFHVGAGAFKSTETTHANVGVEILRVLSMGRISRLYALAGAGIFFNQEQVYDYPNPPVDDKGDYIEPTVRKENSLTYNMGLGIGMEIGSRKGLTASLDVPIVASFTKVGEQATELTRIAPLPSLSIIYYIK